MKSLFFAAFLTAMVLITWTPPAFAARSDPEIEELKRIQETNSRILAETVQHLSAIRQEIQALRGQIEENKHFFEQSSQESQRILRDFDLRLTGMEEKMSLYEGQLSEIGKGGKGAKGIELSGDEGSLYQKAIGEINAQNYKTAITQFDAFLKKYPKSAMADNAQYWKGEAYYGLKQYPEAVLEFQKVVKRYPKSDKVPAAVLKQGYCFYEVKEYTDAKAFLQRVVTQYPKSPEAAKAKDKIQQVDQAIARGGNRPAAVSAPTATPPASGAPVPLVPPLSDGGPADEEEFSDLAIEGQGRRPASY